MYMEKGLQFLKSELNPIIFKAGIPSAIVNNSWGYVMFLFALKQTQMWQEWIHWGNNKYSGEITSILKK